MKDLDAARSYTININKKKYSFDCPDGEEHVQALEEKLSQTIESVSGQDSGFILSDYAMKIAMVLADEVISENKKQVNQIEELKQKVGSMLEELEAALGPAEPF